jgi:hypothetical protein
MARALLPACMRSGLARNRIENTAITQGAELPHYPEEAASNSVIRERDQGTRSNICHRSGKCALVAAA